MKILFLMTDPGNLKYYYETLRALLRNGHCVHVAFFNIERQAKYMLHEKLKAEFPESFSWGQASRQALRRVASSVCSLFLGDRLSFLPCPVFSKRPSAGGRVEIRIIPSFRWLMTRCPLFKTPGGVAFMARLLRMIDEAISASRKMKKFIRHQKSDIVLVTPLLSHSGLQSEYLRAARKLGVVTAHCVTSWDNLTTKGALRGNPNFMIMWNETQKKEAMELHGVSSDRIIVTGAQYFDEWFMHKPSRSRKEFCGINGLSPDRLILLYMCSSNFMAPNEKDFVLKWIRTIRTSESPELAEAGILIRPYPEYVDQWKNVDFSRVRERRGMATQRGVSAHGRDENKFFRLDLPQLCGGGCQHHRHDRERHHRALRPKRAGSGTQRKSVQYHPLQLHAPRERRVSLFGQGYRRIRGAIKRHSIQRRSYGCADRGVCETFRSASRNVSGLRPDCRKGDRGVEGSPAVSGSADVS